MSLFLLLFDGSFLKFTLFSFFKKSSKSCCSFSNLRVSEDRAEESRSRAPADRERPARLQAARHHGCRVRPRSQGGRRRPAQAHPRVPDAHVLRVDCQSPVPAEPCLLWQGPPRAVHQHHPILIRHATASPGIPEPLYSRQDLQPSSLSIKNLSSLFILGF